MAKRLVLPCSPRPPSRNKQQENKDAESDADGCIGGASLRNAGPGLVRRQLQEAAELYKQPSLCKVINGDLSGLEAALRAGADPNASLPEHQGNCLKPAVTQIHRERYRDSPRSRGAVFGGAGGIEKSITEDWFLELHGIPETRKPTGDEAKFTSVIFPMAAQGYRTTLEMKKDGILEPWRVVKKTTEPMGESR